MLESSTAAEAPNLAHRILKLSFIILVIGLQATIVGFVFRNPIALRVANNYLAQHNISLPCADFTLTKSLDINIKKLCLSHPLANTEMTGVKIKWTMYPKVVVHSVQLDKIIITGADELTAPTKTDDQPFSPDKFHQIMANVAQLTLPASIHISQFDYQPFNPLNQRSQYHGQVSASNGGILWSLTDAHKKPIFSGSLKTTGTALQGTIKTDFVKVRDFLAKHNIKAPARFDDALTIQGQLTTEFDWQDKKFSARNQLDNLNISSKQGLFDSSPFRSGPFTISTNQVWQTTLDNQLFQVKIDQPHPLNINLDDNAIVELLKAQKLPEQAIILLKDNPTHGLTLLPQGTVQLDFEQKRLSVSELTLKTRNPQSPLNLKLSNLQLPFEKKPISAEFELTATAKISALKTITSSSVSLTTKGSLSKFGDIIKVNFQPDSQVKLGKIKLTQAAKDQPDILLSSAQSQWQGEITLDKKSVQLNLNIDTQLHQIFANKWAKVGLSKITSHIKGTPENLNINGSLTADDITLAQFKISGDIKKPTINISAKDIQLIDLLGLSLNKSVEIELIDGAVDYALSGQLTDFKAIDQNSLDLSLTVKDLTGEIEKTWIQELNWQQKFNLSKGDITSETTANNFSVGLIEAGSNITAIKATTHISRIQQLFSLKLDNVSGQAFGGTFAVPSFNWPSEEDKPVILQLDSIDLAKLVALEKQKGIVVTGRISGLLPIYIAADAAGGVTISEGEIHNITDGVIQIMDNPVVQQLKQSRTELKLAFDALQNLHYHQLTSTVTMTKDGQMLLETAIKGRNPDLDNDVNFNLNLDYDLLGLIQSARITESFEQSIYDKVQTNKEQTKKVQNQNKEKP